MMGIWQLHYYANSGFIHALFMTVPSDVTYMLLGLPGPTNEGTFPGTCGPGAREPISVVLFLCLVVLVRGIKGDQQFGQHGSRYFQSSVHHYAYASLAQ